MNRILMWSKRWAVSDDHASVWTVALKEVSAQRPHKRSEDRQRQSGPVPFCGPSYFWSRGIYVDFRSISIVPLWI